MNVSPGNYRRLASPTTTMPPARRLRYVLAIGLGLAVLSLAVPRLAGAADETVLQAPMRLVPTDIAPSPSAVPAPTDAPVIEVNPLADIALDSIGVLGPDDGGFGQDMWRGTDRLVVESVLRQVPGVVRSPVMRELARRLLLSIATPPAAQGGVAESGGSSSLLALRIDRLAALGEIDGLNELLAVVPTRQDDETIARTRIDTFLLARDNAESCRLVRNGIAAYHALSYWQKAMVFCNMMAGEREMAMLGLDLLRELGSSDDPAFFTLASAAPDGTAAIPADVTLTPLHLAMLEATERPVPPEAVANAAPGLLLAIARAPKADLEVRARAGEQAGAAGLLTGEALARIYDAYTFEPAELANAISAVASQSGPRARALLYQAARAQTLPATRAEVLRVALQNAQDSGFYQAAVSVHLPLLLEIPANPELAWFAGTAGRALYAAGRFEQASAWLALGRQEAILNPQAATAVATLWPYSRLAGDVALTTDGNLAAWSAMRDGQGGPEGAGEAQGRRQTLLRAVFQALGMQDPLPWNAIAAASAPEARPLPNAALLYALQDAGESGRVGEAILFSLAVLGQAGPADSHILALSTVLTALNRVGLGNEARALAIEAALANGV